MASSSSSPPESSPQHHTQPAARKYSDLEEVFDDLSSRFILNLPDEQLNSLERMCFQVEQAHWFYEDFVREANPSLPSMPLKRFSETFFNACPLLHRWSGDHEGAFAQFMQYKTRVPVCGAIMLNDTWDKVVLVKGWKASAGWGFPKGKINEDEPCHACAVREVLEETGYNLAGQINPADVIEVSIREQQVTLFVVPNVPEDYPFETKTRKEISRIDWFKLSDLPTWKRNKIPGSKFYLITPFIASLKSFINKRKPRALPSRRNNVRANGHRQEHDMYLQDESDSSFVDIQQSYAAQESSSQTSADTTDPQTPSPMYSEPTVHNAVDRYDVAETAMSGQSLDPHFARLLSGLTLSASAAKEITPSESNETVVAPRRPIHTPVAASTAPESPDWSVRMTHAPGKPPSVLQRSAVYMPEETSRGSVETVRAALPQSPVSSSPPSSTQSIGSNNSRIPNSGPPPKRSSTADISPYLSHAVEQPVNGKRLRQLALLESLMDESSQPSARTARTAQPATTALPHPPASANFVSNAFIPFNAPPPPQFASVPPPPHFMPPHVSPLYQQHTPSDVNHSQAIYQTVPSNPPPGPINEDEAFVVRPRTSNTFRPIPPPPSRHFGARASMTQAQFMGILASGTASTQPPLPPHGMPLHAYPPRAGMMSVPPMAMGPMVPPPMMMPITPRVAPAVSAGLLNILNTRGSNGASHTPLPHSQYAGVAPQ